MKNFKFINTSNPEVSLHLVLLYSKQYLIHFFRSYGYILPEIFTIVNYIILALFKAIFHESKKCIK